MQQTKIISVCSTDVGLFTQLKDAGASNVEKMSQEGDVLRVSFPAQKEDAIVKLLHQTKASFAAPLGVEVGKLVLSSVPKLTVKNAKLVQLINVKDDDKRPAKIKGLIQAYTKHPQLVIAQPVDLAADSDSVQTTTAVDDTKRVGPKPNGSLPHPNSTNSSPVNGNSNAKSVRANANAKGSKELNSASLSGPKESVSVNIGSGADHDHDYDHDHDHDHVLPKNNLNGKRLSHPSVDPAAAPTERDNPAPQKTSLEHQQVPLGPTTARDLYGSMQTKPLACEETPLLEEDDDIDEDANAEVVHRVRKDRSICSRLGCVIM
jgi:hypothetical protein